MKTLNELLIDEKGYVSNINCDEIIKRRLMDLGLIKGTCIIPRLENPTNEPRAFEFRGTLIVIREEDARLIEVEESL